jgi:hypothetical protein
MACSRGGLILAAAGRLLQPRPAGLPSRVGKVRGNGTGAASWRHQSRGVLRVRVPQGGCWRRPRGEKAQPLAAVVHPRPRDACVWRRPRGDAETESDGEAVQRDRDRDTGKRVSGEAGPSAAASASKRRGGGSAVGSGKRSDEVSAGGRGGRDGRGGGRGGTGGRLTDDQMKAVCAWMKDEGWCRRAIVRKAPIQGKWIWQTEMF